MIPLNRRKNANLLPVTKIAAASIVLLIVGCGGLYYVNAKNELHRCGERKKQLERELQAIATRDEVVTSRIARMSSFDALRKRQTLEKDAFARLVPVADTLVVRVPDQSAPVETQVRTVSNLQPVR
jgi:hypothetical protein